MNKINWLNGCPPVAKMTTGNGPIRAVAFLWLVIGVWPAYASPTPDEYRQCHQLAAQSVQRCLDERPGYDSAPCWRSAQDAQAKCYADLRASHRPDPKRRAAEDAARRASEEQRAR